MLRRIRRRLADERGMTVVETVLTCVLTLIVTGSSLAVLERAYAHNQAIQGRTESTQIARRAVDEVITRLRNQVCLDRNTPPVIAATGRSLTYYADFGDANPTRFPERHVLSLDTTTGVLSDARATTTTGKPGEFTAAGTRVLAQGVWEVAGTPFMRFYAYDTSSPPEAKRPLNTGTAAVAAADLGKVARVVVTLRALAPGRTDPDLGATVQDEAFVRLVDPTVPSPEPECA